MLIDLLCTDNYVSYNYKIANILGLQSAVYISELLNINNKAIRKEKLDEDSYISIDREYIKLRTTLTEEEQKDIEKALLSLGILECKDRCKVRLNIEVLASLLVSNEELAASNTKLKVKKNRRTKNEVILDNLKLNVVTIKNDELRVAYENWIDSVVAKQGWMSKQSVLSAIDTVDNFSNHDLDKALKLIEIAAINGYRDMNWAVNYFNKEFTNKKSYVIMSNNNIKQTEKRDNIQLSEEVF